MVFRISAPPGNAVYRSEQRRRLWRYVSLGDSLTNATLVPADGLDEELEIDEGGVKRKQIWHYPSRAECLTCTRLLPDTRWDSTRNN